MLLGRPSDLNAKIMSKTENSEASFATVSDEEPFLVHEEVEEQLGDVPTSLEPYQDEPLASS